MLSYLVNLFVFIISSFYFGYLDIIFYTLFVLIPLLLSIAFFTLAERKIMASIQRRKGPNVVGLWGFLQPFADGLKLLSKEIIIPLKSHKILFFLAPFLTLFLSFINWVVIPFNIFNVTLTFNLDLLYVMVISSFSVFSILFAGWSSNSKYALIGSLRAVSQMISYEVSISLILIPIICFVSSLSLRKIILVQSFTTWFILPLFPLAIIFFISILAETNRIPFDLPEAEAELVAGYNVEYSSFIFASFFLGEYSNILVMSSLFVLFFLGGGDFGILYNSSLLLNTSFFYILLYDFCFSFKIIIIAFWFVFIRANLPRYRFDQLMFIGWKVFLPISLSLIFFVYVKN